MKDRRTGGPHFCGNNVLLEIPFGVNLYVPTSGCTTMNESLLGALGIPELVPPNRRRTFKVNLHAPTSGHTTKDKRLPGALGIPELVPPNRRRTFKVTMKGSGLLLLGNVKST